MLRRYGFVVPLAACLLGTGCNCSHRPVVHSHGPALVEGMFVNDADARLWPPRPPEPVHDGPGLQRGPWRVRASGAPPVPTR